MVVGLDRFGVRGLGFGDWGLGFVIWGLGSGFTGSEACNLASQRLIAALH
jgi:hypothetical protein